MTLAQAAISTAPSYAIKAALSVGGAVCERIALARLDLPGELDLVADVQVQLEVKQLAHALIIERVQTLQNLGGAPREIISVGAT